jgi:hypothetical protein
MITVTVRDEEGVETAYAGAQGLESELRARIDNDGGAFGRDKERGTISGIAWIG